MIKAENIQVFNFDGAIRGLRNPYDSWDKSDSRWKISAEDENELYYDIGEKDLSLMQNLYNGGSEHRKYMRQILICMDITAPLYWWKQFDTYKVGTTANSCSTMHTIAKKEFTLDDFSFDDKNRKEEIPIEYFLPMLQQLNGLRDSYLETKDKTVWRLLIQLLPEAYNQKRTVTMNYEVAANIIHQRRNHKLQEWNTFIDILLNHLPYLEEITGEEPNE